MTSMLRPTIHLTAAAALPLLAACGRPTEKSAAMQAPAVPVTVATLGAAESAAPVIATGTFGSRDEIPLAFKIGGVVQRVLVDAGQTVQRGQILAALDLREIEAALTKAQLGVDKAQRDAARVQRLVADSVATAVQLQDATTGLDAAKADLAAARMNREYAVITAPEAGVVLERLVTPGTTVAPGQSIVRLGGSNRGRVLRVALADRDALKVRLGASATVHFDALPDRDFAGRVVLVGQSADPRTGTFSVEVALTGADQLPSGLIGTARIAVAGAVQGNHLPVDALLDARGDSATVYTLPATGAAIAQRTRVRITSLMGDEALVEGLPLAARVIAKGAAYVTPGARVRIVTAATLDSAVTHAAMRTAAESGGDRR